MVYLVEEARSLSPREYIEKKTIYIGKFALFFHLIGGIFSSDQGFHQSGLGSAFK